ncbi:MAG: DUF29 domain-containing protein [Acetobacteraceae bacterium]|nr:DUF29 domain-containing protein [Acetobacteraceae bacterium]MBV8523043.1 DUF29 domain-containing protein [Acetobacteraceae bacterium]
MPGLYEKDIYLWSQQQAEALRRAARAGSDLPIDWENVAEEIESVGRAEKRELINRLIVLLAHLLKWQAQPDRRGNSWRLTIAEQRRRLGQHLQDNPSLKAKLEGTVSAAYGTALLRARRQTGLPETAFPPTCPYTAAQILDDGYLPGDL